MIVEHMVDAREGDYIRAPLTNEEARQTCLVWLSCIGFFALVCGVTYLAFEIDKALYPKKETIEFSNEEIQTQNVIQNSGVYSNEPMLYVAAVMLVALIMCFLIMIKRLEVLHQERPAANRSGSVFQLTTLPREDKINAKSNRFY